MVLDKYSIRKLTRFVMFAFVGEAVGTQVFVQYLFFFGSPHLFLGLRFFIILLKCYYRNYYIK